MPIALAYDKWASAKFPRRTRMLRGHVWPFWGTRTLLHVWANFAVEPGAMARKA